jgi:hypothetical protein
MRNALESATRDLTCTDEGIRRLNRITEENEDNIDDDNNDYSEDLEEEEDSFDGSTIKSWYIFNMS